MMTSPNLKRLAELTERIAQESHVASSNGAEIERSLGRIKWLLGKGLRRESYSPNYGDLVQLNTARLILDAVGEKLLREVVASYLDLLGTSAAVYEANGDYAVGIFSSGWCQLLDEASRNLCGDCSNPDALQSGKWLCHESCWTDAARVAIIQNRPVDIECHGGLRLFAVPIPGARGVIGSMNFGWGDPPRDLAKLQMIAAKYKVPFDIVSRNSEEYESRPSYIVEVAKCHLKTWAKVIGRLVECEG